LICNLDVGEIRLNNSGIRPLDAISGDSDKLAGTGGGGIDLAEDVAGILLPPALVVVEVDNRTGSPRRDV
jgi:hypothetical protein